MPDLVATDPEAVVSFSVEDEWSGDLTQWVRDATTITVFAPGSATGRSLQRALVEVQAAKHEVTAQLVQAVVVNARPPNNRDWQTLRNSCGHRLYSLWLTRAPDRSPLAEESRELQARDPTCLPDDVAEILDERRRLAFEGRALTRSYYDR